MNDESVSEIRYKRSRFTARLPQDRLYSPTHYWVKADADGGYKVGLTRFAIRMLGDIVEFDFEIEKGDRIECGQVIGWVEAFKAVADVYSVIDGRFDSVNPMVSDDPGLIDRDGHREGWLYQVTDAKPDKTCVDAEGYAAILDAHIDKMLGEEQYRNMAQDEGIDDE